MSPWFDRFLHRLSGVSTPSAVSPPPPETVLPVSSPALPPQNSRRGAPLRNKAGPVYPFGLDEPLVWFSPQDSWTIRDACEGCQIIGDTGSGKTTGSGQAIAKAFLRLGFGGLVLTHKSDDRRRWEQYCRETGRLDSLLIVNPRERWRFNFLEYQYSRAGEGAGHTENTVNTFMTLIENRADGGQRAIMDSFWTEGTRRLLRFSLEAIRAAGVPVTMDALKAIIDGIPYAHPTSGQPMWPQGSFLRTCLDQAKRQRPRPGVPSVREIETYFVTEFARPGSDRQSAGVISTFTHMADPFLSGAVKDLFCTTSNFAPDVSRQGVVILIDLPTLEWEDIGRTGALLMKYLWQRAMLRRQGLPPGERPVFLWVDEAQVFATPFDRQFQETARSSFASTVYLTQTINSYYATMEPARGQAQTNALLSNLATKIFHRNNDAITNQWAADAIGKALIRRYSGGGSVNDGFSSNDNYGLSVTGSDQGGGSVSVSGGGGNGFSSGRSVNRGWNEVIDYQIQPARFTTLKGGGPENRYEVHGIVFKAGKTWKRTGRTFLDVTFSQRGT